MFPRMVVFDLDYTLWPFWVDTHVQPPFKIVGGKVQDRFKYKISLYPDVMEILDLLKSKGSILGIASRTEAPSAARSLLEIMNINHYFHHQEIYPGLFCYLNDILN
uniref:Magnesium-dependent phosphatase-1 n=1 Tax=Arcella intermedia TaxID=1963864 RepID=A0A6B2LTR1_9EUKA